MGTEVKSYNVCGDLVPFYLAILGLKRSRHNLREALWKPGEILPRGVLSDNAAAILGDDVSCLAVQEDQSGNPCNLELLAQTALMWEGRKGGREGRESDIISHLWPMIPGKYFFSGSIVLLVFVYYYYLSSFFVFFFMYEYVLISLTGNKPELLFIYILILISPLYTYFHTYSSMSPVNIAVIFPPYVSGILPHFHTIFFTYRIFVTSATVCIQSQQNAPTYLSIQTNNMIHTHTHTHIHP